MFVNGSGHDLKQLIQKFALGGVTSQGLGDYLWNVTGKDNIAQYKGTKNHTAMEHNWDEDTVTSVQLVTTTSTPTMRLPRRAVVMTSKVSTMLMAMASSTLRLSTTSATEPTLRSVTASQH